MKSYFKSLSAEQPDVRFFGLRLVKFVSAIFGSVFLFTLAVTLFDTSALNWKLDVEGLKFFFLDAMKVPGSILAFYLAVLGLIGANHRSEQTKKQIEEASVQNDFANFYKHREEFLKGVKSSDLCNGLSEGDFLDLYSKLFINSRKRDFSIAPCCINELDDYVVKFAKSIPVLFDAKQHEKIKSDLKDQIDDIKKKFFIRASFTPHINAEHNPFDSGHGSLENYLYQFKQPIVHIDFLFKNDPEYKTSELVQRFISLDIPSVPYLNLEQPISGTEESITTYANSLLNN
ncbi:hypothetical protein [Vibrio diabolicus]|uniref:hypothetical protein n=1 Tax=Vibrio diabolicus TaxID=50719 RepID=UPI00215E9929|nr:hypothetical protein [Vibrio diabolicus]MCS0317849.1 hypothetical protein [Vibrio diabolicus]